MTSESKLSLSPEADDQMRSSLHGLQAVTCEPADLCDGVAAQVGDLVLLEVSPNRFNRIELGSVGGQAGHSDGSILILEPRFDFAAAVDRCTIQMISSGRLICCLSALRKVMTCSERIAPGKKRK